MSIDAGPEALVLLPGMGCSDRLWEGVLPALGGRDVVRARLVGRDLESCVADLLPRLPRRFALAGLSLGGIVAMAMVRMAPERVTRLCLASTNARPPTPAQRAAWSDHLAALAAGRGVRELQADLLPTLVRPSAADELSEEILDMADDVGREAFVDQLRLQTTRVDERPGLRAVRVPTLVLAGADDALCPVSRHEEIASLIPRAHLEVLPDTGHLSPLERPDAVAELLGAWLVTSGPSAHAPSGRSSASRGAARETST